MSIDDATATSADGGRRAARRPRGAAGRRQVPGPHQVRDPRLEHPPRRARPPSPTLTLPRAWTSAMTPDRTSRGAGPPAARCATSGTPLVGRARRRSTRSNGWQKPSRASTRRCRPAPRGPGEHPFADHQVVDDPQGRFDHDFDDRPVSGRSSPWGLDLELHRYGDEIEARVTLRSAHEGAPDRSHGGIIAALFDDVFGYVLGVVHQPAFTGDLYIRYQAPTPLFRELACRVRLDARDRPQAPAQRRTRRRRVGRHAHHRQGNVHRRRRRRLRPPHGRASGSPRRGLLIAPA